MHSNYCGTLAGLEDWRSDGYRWRQMGSIFVPKHAPVMKKVIFNLLTDKGVTKTFRKCVYSILANDKERVVVHYVGDESVAIDFPHGLYNAALLTVNLTITLILVQDFLLIWFADVRVGITI